MNLMEPVSYVTCFRKLKISEPLIGHIELIPGVNISNDPEVIARLLTPEFKRAVGVIEADHLRTEANVVFGEFELAHLRNLPPDRFLLVILIWIDMLLKNAWLIKDHAIECDAAFLRVDMPGGISWTKNYLAVRPSLSGGYTDTEVSMTASELGLWGQTNDLVESYLSDASSSSLEFMMEKSYARSGRAMRFVSAARGAPDLAFKIANYCSALETLFTTESSEVAHKLAERVAFFLGERGHNRREVFSKIKNAYGVRSKLVHGDTLKANQIAELPALSGQCDGYLRIILRAIFESKTLKAIFDSHNSAIEKYFSQLILGPATEVFQKTE